MSTTKMDAADLLAFFDRPIAFHRPLVDVCGSVSGALLLSQAIYWQRIVDKRGEPEGWFYKTGKEWLEETGMHREEFQTARRKLVESGVLKYEVRGMPARCFYQVQVEVLSLRLSRKLDCGNPTYKNAGTPPTSVRESRKLSVTTESNAKTTTDSACAAEPHAFTKAWEIYPKREGGNPRKTALKAWSARIRAGTSAEEMQAGLERYRAYVQAKGILGTDKVMMAATFFGPDERWKEDWAIAPKDPTNPEKPAPRCVDCGGLFTGGWTQQDRGRVCNRCFSESLHGRSRAATL